jgi:signal transduction histidine kinase
MDVAAPENASILLVDDERDFVETLSLRLEARGYTVLRAYDADAGLAILQNREVDVVVLDVNLPGKSGLEIVDEIHRLRPFSEIIMLTGEAGVRSAIQGMKLGVLDYLIKPVPLAKLLDSIQRARSHRGARLESQRMIEMSKLAAIGGLAQGVAHEINNPVNVMSHEAGWILDLLDEEEFQDLQNLAELKRAATKIQDMGQRCKQITSKLLILGRRQDLLLKGVDLAALVSKTLADRATRAEQLGVRVAPIIGALPELLDLSAADMEQVLANLTDNALDAMEQGGGVLTVRLAIRGDMLELEVTDTGRGVAHGDQTRIFEPFFSTRPVGKGTGLGLSICQSIVNNLGGDIRVRSELGRGATFSARIPLTGRLGPDAAPGNQQPATTNAD